MLHSAICLILPPLSGISPVPLLDTRRLLRLRLHLHLHLHLHLTLLTPMALLAVFRHRLHLFTLLFSSLSPSTIRLQLAVAVSLLLSLVSELPEFRRTARRPWISTTRFKISTSFQSLMARFSRFRHLPLELLGREAPASYGRSVGLEMLDLQRKGSGLRPLLRDPLCVNA